MSHQQPAAVATTPWSLEGRTMVVTGGTKGIGAAIVASVLERGASTVLYCSRSSSDETSEMHASLCQTYPNRHIQHVVCDVSTQTGRQVLVDAVAQLPKNSEDVAALHGLVNNVGINVRKDMLHQTEDEYERMFRTNVDSAYWLCRALYPYLKQAGANSSSIVNVSSAAGVQSSGTGIVYAMTKAAINQLTKTLACEWASDNIRVNAVTPWMTWTPLLKQAIQDNPNQLDKVHDWTPMHRLADPQEIASPVLFLLMNASQYMTGQVVGVDGGLTAQGFDGPCVTPP